MSILLRRLLSKAVTHSAEGNHAEAEILCCQVLVGAATFANTSLAQEATGELLTLPVSDTAERGKACRALLDHLHILYGTDRETTVLLSQQLLLLVDGLDGEEKAELRETVSSFERNLLYWCVNNDRYVLAKSLADQNDLAPSTPAIDAAVAAFRDTGICVTTISPDGAGKILPQLDFGLDAGNRHIRSDWWGNTVKPLSLNLITTEPSQSVLDLLFEELYRPEVAGIIQRCIGGDYRFLNCRPFYTPPHSAATSDLASYHYDGCPPSWIRAIAYLVDVDEDTGPFEYLDKTGVPQRVLGPQGTMFIFDANRILHRATAPRLRARRVIDLVVVPRTPSQPRCIVWAGMNNWPGDPFHFHVRGMRTSPAGLPELMATDPAVG